MFIAPKNGKLYQALFIALTCVGPAFAQDRETTAVTVTSNLFRPATLEVQDKFYRDNLSGADDAIRMIYSDRWRFHDTQLGYYQPRNQPVHLDIGTFSRPGVGPSEADVRKEFANAAFRMRIDSAFRKFLASEKGSGVRSVHQFVEGFKAQTVKVSNDPKAAEIRMGYDVLSDVSRLEYVKGGTGAGFYHGTFMSSLTGSKPLLAAATFRVWQDFGVGKPVASLGYVVGGRYFQGSVSKALTPAVTGELIGTRPAYRDASPSSILARMTYRF